jgi:EamA domain-containing membrane protein RarD
MWVYDGGIGTSTAYTLYGLIELYFNAMKRVGRDRIIEIVFQYFELH